MFYSCYWLLISDTFAGGFNEIFTNKHIFADYPARLSESHMLIITNEQEALK